MAAKNQLTQINETLDWIVKTNQTLEMVQGDTLQMLQYQRRRQQFMDQLNSLLAESTQPLRVIVKSSRRAA